MRIMAAVLVGKTTRAAGPPVTVTFRDINDTVNRVVAELASSNRVAITLDAD
jgi:hypothetical protein